MSRASRVCTALALVGTVIGAMYGCAVADTSIDGIPGKDGGADARHDSGIGGADTGGNADSNIFPTEDTSPRVDTGGGGGDDTGGGGDDASTGTDTGGGGSLCAASDPSACPGATSIGKVSGDTGGDTVTSTGTDSGWVTVKVSEDDSSLFSSKDLRVQLTLTSPSSENFDLYVYEGKTVKDGGGVECSSVAGSSTNAGTTDVVNLTWSDNHPIGGADDTRTITVEVRAASGVKCDGTSSWTIKVEGNK